MSQLSSLRLRTRTMTQKMMMILNQSHCQNLRTRCFLLSLSTRGHFCLIAIAALSILCLLLSLSNKVVTIDGMREIPANVGTPVKIAQFASIFIALLMEEEIPTGLHLLRRVPKTYFKSKFPDLKYYKFVASCSLVS